MKGFPKYVFVIEEADDLLVAREAEDFAVIGDSVRAARYTLDVTGLITSGVQFSETKPRKEKVRS